MNSNQGQLNSSINHILGDTANDSYFVMEKTEWSTHQNHRDCRENKAAISSLFKVAQFMSQPLPALVIGCRSSHSFYYLDPEDNVHFQKDESIISHVNTGEHKMYFTFSFQHHNKLGKD